MVLTSAESKRRRYAAKAQTCNYSQECVYLHMRCRAGMTVHTEFAVASIDMCIDSQKCVHIHISTSIAHICKYVQGWQPLAQMCVC
jgi:hypothetical protein